MVEIHLKFFQSLQISFAAIFRLAFGQQVRTVTKATREGMRMVVAISLMWSLRTEGVRVSPEVIAEVSILLAGYFEVDCIQIFRTDDLPLSKVEEIHRMWKILAMTDTRITTGIYTFKRYLKRRDAKKKKVSCYRSLKIMSDEEESKKGYEEFSTNFSIKDAIWVLYSESLSVQFFQDATVLFDDVIIIAEMKSEELILFHEVYKVASGYPLRVLYLGNWTREQGLRASEDEMYERRSDLEGVALRTASVQSWPASYWRSGRWEGFLIQLWKEIQSLINCTSIDVNTRGENWVGKKLENGSWNGLVGMAMRDEIDVIVTEVVIDKERSHALDFFYPIMKSSFQIYTRHLGYQWQWASILNPFHVSVWMGVVGWVVAATVFWTVIHNSCISHGLGAMDFGKFSPLNSFFFVLQALCQQGYQHSPSSYACRVFFFVSYAVSSVLIPSFSASLVSSLAQKVHLTSFDSLEEMVADGSYRLLVKENTTQDTFFSHSNDEFFKLAYEKLVKPVPEKYRKLGIRDSVKALCHLDNYAVMGVEDVIESRLHHLITLDCPVVHLNNPVSTIYLTMATAKGNPYWGLINFHLGKLIDTGIVEKLRRAEFPLGHTTGFRLKDSEEVGIRQLISAFLFMGGFVVVSIFLLLLEIQHLCWRTRAEKSKRKKRGLRLDHYGHIRYQMKMQKYLKSRGTSPGFFLKL